MALLSILGAQTAEARRRALASAPPEILCAQAQAHGASALLQQWLTEETIQWPEAVADSLKRRSMGIIGNGLRMEKLCELALASMSAAGIRPVVLKGYGLGFRLYANPLIRPTNDVDLLVAPDELATAEKALATAGLKEHRVQDRAFLLSNHHHLVFVGQLGMVELHFRALAGFGASLENEPMLRGTRDAVLLKQPVRYLSVENEVAFLCIHAAQHLFTRLVWLYDVKLLVEKHPDVDWDRVAQVGLEANLAVPLYLALTLLQTHFQVAVPDSVLRALRPPYWQRALAGKLFSADELENQKLLGSPVAQAIFRPVFGSQLRRVAKATALGAWRATRRAVLR